MVILFIAILIRRLFLRLNGVTDETRITWTNTDLILRGFSTSCIFHDIRAGTSLGRPGLNILRLATLWLENTG